MIVNDMLVQEDMFPIQIQDDMFRLQKIIAEQDSVIEYMQGSAHSVSDAERAFNLSTREVEHILEEGNVHLCEECGWWFNGDEEGDAFNDDGVPSCGDCLSE